MAADNRAEIETWIDERIEDLVAGGLDREEARHRAVAEFGDRGGAERYALAQDIVTDRRARAALWCEALVCDLRIAIRTLWRARTVTTVVLLTFAVGVGAVTAVFSVVHATLLRPLPYGDEATLVQLQAVESGTPRPAVRFSAAALAGLRERTTSFRGIAGIEGGNIVITDHGDPEQVMTAGVTPDAFSVMQVQAAIGHTFDAASEAAVPPRAVLLLEGLWRRRFQSDPQIVGQHIHLDTGTHRIAGVMPPGFRVPAYEAAELITPRDLTPLLQHPNNARVRFLRLFARLKPGVTLHAAQADVDAALAALRRLDPASVGGVDVRLQPIRAAIAGEVAPRVLVLFGAAAFVLLIACANVAGLLLSRAIARRQELSVRVALGAGRRRLIRQFLTEGAVIAAIGGALGLLIALGGIRALQHVAGTALPTGTVIALETRVAVGALVAAIGAAFIASLIPAIAATRGVGRVLDSENSRVTPSRGSRRLRLGLVAVQLGVSVVLLVGAGLFLRTFDRLSSIDLGYRTDQTVTFRLPFTRPRSSAEQDVFWAALYEQLDALPGVTAVGGGNVPTSGQSTIVGLEIEGRVVERSELPDVRYTPASDHYFAALNIPTMRGRVFLPADRDGAPPVAVVSSGLAAQLWPGGDPIGARARVGPTKPWLTIVGIVGDVRMGGADPPLPSIYTSQRQDHWPGGGAVIVRAGGDAASLASGIRAAVKRVDPTLPIVGLRTLDAFRSETPAIAERRLLLQLTMAFALIAVAVSAAGVYGMTAYAVESRRREFAIRMAMGASPARLRWLTLRDAVQTSTAGALVGVPVAVAIASQFGGLLYGVSPFDPATVAAVLGTLAVVVVVSAWGTYPFSTDLR